MSRATQPTTTALGFALRNHRGARPLMEAAEQAEIPHSTLSRLERGTHRPSTDTARAVARWLGWTLEQVLDAADQPVPTAPPSQKP